MKRLLGVVSPWVLAGIAVWLAVTGIVANWVKHAFVKIGDGPCGDPCVFVPPPIDWFPVLGTAIAVASIATVLFAGVVLLIRRMSPRQFTGGKRPRRESRAH